MAPWPTLGYEFPMVELSKQRRDEKAAKLLLSKSPKLGRLKVVNL